jgi:hypothetical protein
MGAGRDLSRANRGRRIANATRAPQPHTGDHSRRQNSSAISCTSAVAPACTRDPARLV